MKKIRINNKFFTLTLVFAWLLASNACHAGFQNTSPSKGNGVSAHSLDLEISFPASNTQDSLSLSNAVPEDTVETSAIIENSGSINLQYTISFEKVSGNDLLCQNLELEASVDNSLIFTGNLSDFSFSQVLLLPKAQNNWDFQVNVPKNLQDDMTNLECSFDVSLVAWQTSQPSPNQGWADREAISSNSITTGQWDTPDLGEVVMNEFVPNPVGQDSAVMPQGEWIEIFNNSPTSDFDLEDWYFKDASGNKLTISTKNSDNNGDTTDSGETIISPGGYLVVYDNSLFSLNNDGDTISIFNSSDELMDEYTYGDTSIFAEGKSYARFPEGIGPWVDPKATPGEKNELTGSDLLNAQLIILDECFNEKQELIKNENQPLCSPAFVEYIGLIKDINSKKLISSKEIKDQVKGAIASEPKVESRKSKAKKSKDKDDKSFDETQDKDDKETKEVNDNSLDNAQNEAETTTDPTEEVKTETTEEKEEESESEQEPEEEPETKENPKENDVEAEEDAKSKKEEEISEECENPTSDPTEEVVSLEGANSESGENITLEEMLIVTPAAKLEEKSNLEIKS